MLRALLLLLLALPAWGGDFFVRRQNACNGAPCGLADGSIPANAYDDFADVVWGAGGVQAGDTLYVLDDGAGFGPGDADTATSMIDQGVAGVIVDGNGAPWGFVAKAVLDGDFALERAYFCNTAALCLGSTVRNLELREYTRHGIYVRSDLSPTSTSNITINNVSCQDVIGLAANFPTCYQIFGGGATLTNVSSLRTTDDGIHIEGDNALVTDWDIRFPAWQASTELGDCIQIALQIDNARVRRGVCDKSNYSSKQAVAFTAPDVSDDNAEVTDVTAIFPLTGNGTWQSKVLYSEVPNTIFERNITTGGYVGIWMAGAGQTARSNIVIRPENVGIQPISTVSSGTHTVANNTVSGATRCLDLNGGASVTSNVYNNSLNNCGTGIQKGGSSTIAHGNNAGFNLTINVNGCCSPLAITANPQFIGGSNPTTAEGFCPQAASPLVGAGTPTSAKYDFRHRRFNTPPSIGACEIGGKSRFLLPTLQAFQ